MAAKENETLLKEIRDNLTYGLRAWGDVREEAKTDMRYVSGDPWDPKEKKARKDAMRPALVLDELNQYINQVVNDLRSKKTGIKVVPTASSIPGENPELSGVEELAEFRGDLIRQIEYKSSAQQAYITSFENAVQRSYGWHRVNKRYVTEKSFEQELEIRRIPNPDTILPDPAFKEADASDMKWCFAMDYVSKKEFKQRWPNAKIQDFSDQHAEMAPEWIRETDIRIAEYWRVETKKKRLLLIQPEDSEIPKSIFEDELPRGVKKEDLDVLKERQAECFSVVQYLTNGVEILSETPWEGKWIPLIPVFGKELYVDSGEGSKRMLMSLTRLARDPYMLYCYYRSTEAEVVSLTPKTPTIGYEGQFEGHEGEWETAHTVPRAYLQAKATTEATGSQILPLPQRQIYDPPIMALEAGAEGAKRSIQNAMSMYNSSVGRPDTKAGSGVAIERLQKQSYIGSYHLMDNFNRALEHTGRIINDLIPKVYDTVREVALRNASGESSIVKINQRYRNPKTEKDCLYDTTIGEYDVTISTGPSFASQRQEASAFADTLISMNPELFGRIGDLIIKLKELGPIGDEMATRMAPPEFAAQEGKEKLPPQALQAIAQAQEQIQQLDAFAKNLHEENTQLKQEKQAKIIEMESRERIATMQAHTEMIIAQAKIGEEKDLETFRVEIEKIVQTLKDQRQHALLDHSADLKVGPGTGAPGGNT